MNEPEKLTLYTIGHSNHTSEEFLTLLQTYHITVLVDVRSAPYSKFAPQFNKSELQAFLEQRGIQYRYAGEYLGGRPKEAELYKDDELPDEDTTRAEFLKKVDYKAMMCHEKYLKGVTHLLTIVRQATELGGNVTIMCSEGNPLECHRHHLIARSLVDPKLKIIDNEVDIVVNHIERDGNVTPITAKNFPEEFIQERLF
ncbi:MAG: hypothetical protein BroJett018_15290 [Chloroflexota bacterium]|nr:DUF488 domain-containing protein [Chloroflexota bacterium]NOG65112.1 DUF488 domain-containing protein [Chloroflexota bacterium]GIK63735.1 MAG: hypothetical protein BroJett018_15290 [Chloroflexota bacterium]